MLKGRPGKNPERPLSSTLTLQAHRRRKADGAASCRNLAARSPEELADYFSKARLMSTGIAW